MTLLITHADCLDHDTGPGHPEHAGRLSTALEALNAPAFTTLERTQAELAHFDDLLLCHQREYLDHLFQQIPLQGRSSLDADTVVSPASGRAALGAAGAVIDGINAVCEKQATNVFCAVRPPGHHAEPDKAMGFCLINAIAVGGQYALKQLGLQRVAIIDFDVHHGNGTQAACWSEPNLLYVSSHQMPLYPGTGEVSESGDFDNIVNLPLTGGADGRLFREAYLQRALPLIRAFKPELLLVSAGFDAHRLDPLAGLNLDTEDFHWITQQLMAVADEYCEGRLVSVMEGGYSLVALKDCVTTHVRALTGCGLLALG